VKVWTLQGNQLKTFSRRRLAIMRSKQTAKKTMRGRSTKGVRKDPQEEIIARVSRMKCLQELKTTRPPEEEKMS
jgi:hypothetical protein